MKRTVLVALVAVALAGCGDAGSASSDTVAASATTAAPSDEAAAQAALLQVSDFPARWIAGPKAPNDVHCPAVDAAERYPNADSGRFSQPRVHAASHEVVVFPSAAKAQAALRELGSRATFDCIAHATEAATRSGVRPGIRVGRMTAVPLPLPRLGDGTTAARLTLTASGSGMRVQVDEDVVFTRVGRGVSMLALLSQGTRDDALLTQLATRAAQRLHDALTRR